MIAMKEINIAPVEFKKTHYVANAELGVTPDDLLKPQFWAHVSGKLKPLDTVEVRAEDGSFYAELLVRDKGRGFAKVVFLPGYPLMFSDIVDIPAMDVGGEYEIVWKGPQNKFRVVRKTDNHTMKEGFTDKESGRKWVVEHVKALDR